MEINAAELMDRLEFLYNETKHETIKLGIKQAMLAVEDIIQEQDRVYDGLYQEMVKTGQIKTDA